MALEQELAFFDHHRAHLVAEHMGKYALIKEAVLVGTFDSAEAAYVEGLRQFGNVPFLVKQVLPEDPVVHLPALSLGLLRAHS